MNRSVWVGFDDREAVPFAVARHTIAKWCSQPTAVNSVVLQDLVDRGWYRRKTEVRGTDKGDVLWDVISEAPMSTQFAIARFFTPMLATPGGGWALFVDSDVFARAPLDDLFSYVEQFPDKALFCVPHLHTVEEGEAKKEGQVQTNYRRKNWSSVMLFNLDHFANHQALTLGMLNTVPGRDLHRFCWLNDDQIGSLDFRWNHLVGVKGCHSDNPAIVHFTNGGPWLPEYRDVEFADEWRAAFREWLG